MKCEWKKWYIQIWSSRLVRYGGSIIGLGKSAMAFAFWPFLVIRSDLRNSESIPELTNHEKIHLRQQLELLVIGAEILYLLEFIYARLFLKLPKKEAYYYVSLEQEAHINAPNLNYLQKRKLWALFPYLFSKKEISRDQNGVLVFKDKTTITHS